MTLKFWYTFLQTAFCDLSMQNFFFRSVTLIFQNKYYVLLPHRHVCGANCMLIYGQFCTWNNPDCENKERTVIQICHKKEEN